MQTQKFIPSPRYLTKMYVSITIVAFLFLIAGIIIGLIIMQDPNSEEGASTIVFLVSIIGNVVWWAPALVLARAYYRSLSYEIQDDEVIVRVGILTQSVKHVPYRTVTNITVKRDIFDRWFFDLGSLNIQTAGMSGTTGAEENLVGLPNFQEAYQIVATQLQRFRGGMAPTAAGTDEVAPETPDAALSAILTEVRAIRQALEERQ